MDPSQSDSPWYQYACDFDMYMHATTGLIMDCRCNRSNIVLNVRARCPSSSLSLETGNRESRLSAVICYALVAIRSTGSSACFARK